MKKILLFICLVTLALEVSASTDLHFIPNPSTTMDMTQLTTYVGETSGGKTLYFYHSGGSDASGAIKISVKSAKALTGSSTIASSNYSFGTVSRQGSNSNNYYFKFTAKVAGVYTIYMYNQASETNLNATCTITVLNTTNLVYNNKTVSLTNPEHIVKLSDCKGSTNSSGTISYSWNGSTPTGAVLDKTTGTLSITEPGTYNLRASQAQTSTYFYASANFTITAYPPLYHKPMSCIVNDLDITALGNAEVEVNSNYYSTLDENWASNVQSIRSLITDMYYYHSPTTMNHMEVPELFSRNVTTRMKLDIVGHDQWSAWYGHFNYMTSGEKNYFLAKYFDFWEDQKFDYVLYNNYDMEVRNIYEEGNGDLPRSISFHGRTCKKDVYYTMCIPFGVSAENMPVDFVFEGISEQRRWNDNIDKMEIGFQQVDHLEAGVPYLYKYTGSSVQKQLVLNAAAGNSTETFYMKAQPVNSSPHFQGTFINLIDKDLHQRTVGNPYNNGYSANGNDENTLFDSFFNDLKNGSPLYALNSNNGKIEKLGSNNSIRPFRAYFRFSDEEVAKDGATLSAGAKLITIRHFSLDEGDEATTIFNLNTQEQEELVDVYDLKGIRRATKVAECEALKNLPRGIYILSNGKKISK